MKRAIMKLMLIGISLAALSGCNGSSGSVVDGEDNGSSPTHQTEMVQIR